MENSILYIEDYTFQRETILDVFQSKRFKDILAPSNIEECENIITSNNFKGAVIDYNLNKWVGSVNENIIKIHGHECFNGIHLAERLREINKDIHIGLFSSHEDSLKAAIANSSIKNSVEIIEIKGAKQDAGLVGFLEKFYQLKVVMKPLHNISGELSPEINSFLAKKIYQSRTMGEFYWKAGEYAWLVGVNKDISSKYSDIDKLGSSYTNTNREEEFILGIDKEDFCLSIIIDKLANTKIDTQEIFKEDYHFNYKSNKFIFDYFITKAFCNKYLSGKITASKFIDSICKIGEYAKFETQKTLFKSAANEGKSKEQIQEYLSEFTLNGFQKILDIYTGRVDDIKNEIAFIKLSSVSSSLSDRIERFNADFLMLNNLEENSQFEYTIFKLPYGGITSHIELL